MAGNFLGGRSCALAGREDAVKIYVFCRDGRKEKVVLAVRRGRKEWE